MEGGGSVGRAVLAWAVKVGTRGTRMGVPVHSRRPWADEGVVTAKILRLLAHLATRTSFMLAFDRGCLSVRQCRQPN